MTLDDVRTSACVFKMLTGQGQGRRHFRAKNMHWEEGRVKWNRERVVNRPERALGADTVPQRKRKGNREDVYSGQE